MGLREILDAFRAGLVTIIILILVNTILVLFNITLNFIIYNQCTVKQQAQEYINPYNGQPVPELTIIDGELPD